LQITLNCFGAGASKYDIEKLQEDLKRLCEWSYEWLVLFNNDKCKIMHIGYSNNKIANYEINGIKLNEVNEECDLV
jgi:hypothetical protein